MSGQSSVLEEMVARFKLKEKDAKGRGLPALGQNIIDTLTLASDRGFAN